MPIIVAIDGPAGSGKSSVAKELATDLDFSYLDTGGMYRTFTYFLLENGVNLENSIDIIENLRNINIDYRNNNYYLNGHKLNKELRTTQINQNVSKVAAIKEVRETAVNLQRELSKKMNTILDGRDIGSVVFPNANFKFYLDASAKTRADRRFLENNTDQSYQEVLDDIIKRDEFDKNREESPLIITDDAIYIDTSDYSLEQVVEILKKEIEVNR